MKAIVFGFVVSTVLTACVSDTPRRYGRIDPAYQPITSHSTPIESAKIPTPAPPISPVKEDRIDLNVHEVDARTFFLGLMNNSGYNIVVHPDVSGKISLQLKKVSVPEIMDIVRDVYGYEFQRRGDVYTVNGNGSQTAIIPVSYLNVNRKGSSETRVSAGPNASSQNTGGSATGNNNQDGNPASSQRTSTKIETLTESDFWRELENGLQLLISGNENAKVIVNPQAGLVIARARPNELRHIRQFLRSSQTQLQKQVILEAKIIEITLGDSFQAGIDWTSLMTQDDGDTLSNGMNGQVLQQTPSNNPVNGVFSAVFNGSSFDATLELLKTRGEVQVLSSPRISTLSNQKAVIKAGSDEFFVTSISNNSVTSGAGTSNTPQVNFASFFSGVALDVTPHIGDSNDIVLHIHPSVTEVTDQTKQLQVFNNNFTLPLAFSTVRETDAVVKTRSGQVVIIGGLMQDKRNSEHTGIPWLSDIPWLGGLFRQTRDSISKSELVILLRAVVTDDAFMQDEVERSTQRMQLMSLPERQDSESSSSTDTTKDNAVKP